MITVLYVDDEPDLCELGKLFLEQSGEMKVDTCTSARAALALPGFSSYDAVIADYQMPEMDGIEFLKEVRARHSDLPFVLFTGRGREEIVIAAINGGADFYLQKGGDPTAQFAELAHKIRIAVERRRAKTALKDSEQRFADIISFLPDATFAIDREGTVIAWNRAIEEMTGVPAPEMLGRGDHEYGLPFYGERRPILIDLVFQDTEEIRSRYPFVQQREDRFISEIYLSHLFGGRGAFLWFIASPLYNAAGEVVGAIESIRDITDRKKAEKALLESGQRLNDIINFLPDATLAVDRDGKVIVWNRAIEKVTGISASEMLGKGDHEYAIPFYGEKRRIFLDLIFNPDDDVAGNYTHFVREGDTLIAETDLARPKGRMVSMMVKASPLYNAAGEVIGAIESMRDISAQKLAESARMASERRLNDIINFLPDATFAIDREGTVIAWNRAIEEMTGVPAPEMLGKGDHEYGLPFYGERRPILIDLVFQDKEEIRSRYPFVQQREDRFISEIYLSHLFGGRGAFLWFIASPLYNAAGEVVGAIESIRDITALRNAESAAIHARNDWETIFRAIGHPAIILDAGNRIIEANDAMVRVAGVPLSDLLGKACYEVFHAPGINGPPERCPFELLKEGKATGIMEEDIEALGGLYHVSCTPVFDPDGNLEKVIHIAMDVTERHRIQEELRAAIEQMTASQEQLKAQFDELAASEQRFRESEARYRELADMLPQIVFEMDPGGKVTYANRCALETFGFAGADGVAGIQALDAIHPSDHGRIMANMEKMVRGIPFEDHEYTAVRSDGSAFPVVVYSSLIKKEGRVVGFRGIMADISPLKKAEEALFESREKYRILVETANEGIWVVDDQFRTVYTNPRMREIFGYREEEMQGRPVWDFVPAAEAASMKADLELRRAGTPGRYERAWVRKDGSAVWCLTSGTPLFSRDGTFIGSFGVFTDITDRRRIEDEVRIRQQQLDNLMQNLPAGIFRTTASAPAERIMANPILARIFGYDTVDDFMASSIEDSYDDPRDRERIVKRLIDEGVVAGEEVRMKKKDGERIWVSLSAVAVPGPDGAVRFIDGIITDITARKSVEDALFEATRRLKLLNSVTRHDIMNQLLALKGFVDVASMKSTDPEMSEYLEKFKRISETITSHIEFMRAYQELGINVPCWLPLGDVIDKTATPVTVTLSDACRQTEIFADPMLEQVFFNLFENAFRHGQKTTRIWIRCGQEGDRFRIIVEDDGIGIPSEHKEKIFTKGFGKNTGLGLFLVKEILAITGITIAETGIPGTGTRFEILVPKGAFRSGNKKFL